MISFPVAIAVILCLVPSTAPTRNQVEVFRDSALWDFASLDARIAQNVNADVQNDVALQENACDCGPDSKGCKITENGTKVCECEYHYRQENGLCKDWCDDRIWTCENGGICVNESCQCQPGTRGGFCKTVDACEGFKGPLLCGDPDKVLCMFDAKTLQPYCMCRTYDYLYLPKVRDCIECDCGKFGSCSLVDGKKTCKCNEGAALRKVRYWGDIVDRCEVCDCGENSNGCSFDGLYSKVCDCKKGFSQQPDLGGEKCNECNCGPHGQCYFRGWYQYCNCDEGYKPFLNKNRTELTCQECDCGKNGKCSFKEEVKQCQCNPGYALRDGICTACQCYVSNETAPCTFNNKIQKCLCPDGYEATKFICKDIDECLNSSNSCPSTTDCHNIMGSYECVCKDGYAPKSPGSDPKKEGCKDIDECEDEKFCPRKHTICFNLPGSYSCTCEKGYVPIPPNIHPKDAGCEKEKKDLDGSSPWRTGIIILSIILCICIIGILMAMYLRRRSVNRSTSRSDTTVHYTR